MRKPGLKEPYTETVSYSTSSCSSVIICLLMNVSLFLTGFKTSSSIVYTVIITFSGMECKRIVKSCHQCTSKTHWDKEALQSVSDIKKPCSTLYTLNRSIQIQMFKYFLALSIIMSENGSSRVCLKLLRNLRTIYYNFFLICFYIQCLNFNNFLAISQNIPKKQLLYY